MRLRELILDALDPAFGIVAVVLWVLLAMDAAALAYGG
jgi:hypothetical protein